MPKPLLVIVGLILLTGALPVSILVFSALPPGEYPAAFIGLPALPLLWAGLICLRGAGWPVDRFVSERPYDTAGLISLLFFVALRVAMVAGIF